MFLPQGPVSAPGNRGAEGRPSSRRRRGNFRTIIFRRQAPTSGLQPEPPGSAPPPPFPAEASLTPEFLHVRGSPSTAKHTSTAKHPLPRQRFPPRQTSPCHGRGTPPRQATPCHGRGTFPAKAPLSCRPAPPCLVPGKGIGGRGRFCYNSVQCGTPPEGTRVSPGDMCFPRIGILRLENRSKHG